MSGGAPNAGSLLDASYVWPSLSTLNSSSYTAEGPGSRAWYLDNGVRREAEYIGGAWKSLQAVRVLDALMCADNPLHLLVSDSVGAGKNAGGTTLNAGSFFEKSAALINAAKTANIATAGLVSPTSRISVTANSQWTVAGWTGANYGAASGAAYTDSDSGTLTFTPLVANQPYDRFRFMFVANSGSRVVTFTPSDGSPIVTIDCANYPLGPQWVEVPLLRPSLTASVAISWVSGAAVYILAAGVRNSLQPAIRFGNAGIAGAAVADWIKTNTFDALPWISAVRPKRTTILLGRNDVISGISAETFEIQLRTLVARCKQFGFVDIATLVPGSAAGAVAHDPEFVAVQRAVASDMGCGLIDFYSNVFGGTFQASLMADENHPNAAGQDAMAAHFAQRYAGD